MVDQEAIRLVARLAIAAQCGRDRLTLLAGVGKDEALATARMLEDVGQSGVGHHRRCVRGLFVNGKQVCRAVRHFYRRLRRRIGRRLIRIGRLLTVIEEVLHGEAPLDRRALYAGNDGAPFRTCGKELPD